MLEAASAATASVRVLGGSDALSRLGPRLDALLEETGAPVTARRPWLEAWLACWGCEPLVVTVESPAGHGRRLDAVAPLAVRRGRTGTTVVAVGDGPSDEIRLPARDAASACLLVDGIGLALEALDRPWRLALRHLPPHDEVARAVTKALPHAALEPGDVSPRLDFSSDRSLRAYVSRNHHQQGRRLHNRLQRDGLQPVVSHVGAPEEVAAVLAEVRDVCRARDAQLGRPSRMDDPAAGPFFDRVAVEHAERGEVRLTLLHLDGALAAYVLVFLDRGTARMWQTRMDPRWQEHGVGRLAQDAAVQAALDDPSCSAYDFMRGNEPYKWSLANGATRSWDLLGCSGALAWSGWIAARHAKGALRDLRDQDRRVAAVLSRLQRARQRRPGSGSARISAPATELQCSQTADP